MPTLIIATGRKDVRFVNTKNILPLLAAMLLAACILTGCQSPKAKSPSRSSASTRNNCYSLLHQLLDEQKDVSMLRFIKPEHADVKNLVKRIATTSGTGATLLEKFARDDPSIRLDDIRRAPRRSGPSPDLWLAQEGRNYSHAWQGHPPAPDSAPRI